MSRSLVIAAAFALALAACSKSRELCGDGLDNDGNGQVDCEDAACAAGASCGPNGLVCGADRTCSACSGNGGKAEPNGEVTCGDGVDNDCDGAVDCDDPDCQPKDGSAGGLCDATGQTCAAPDPSGKSRCGLSSSGGGPDATPIGLLRLAQVEHDVLGAMGSGYHEQSLLVFEVLAADGNPIPGLSVKFSHEAQGGSFIGPVASCTSGASPVCSAQGTTDAAGKVGVVLHSGRRYATLSVHASATAAGSTRELDAGGFAVVGALASGARLSVDCRPYNVPALTTTDCFYSRYAGQFHDVRCTATLADRYGNPVAVPTLVSFRSEAGAISPAALTPEYAPASDGAGLGQAVGILNAYGSTLPLDVDPFAAERSVDVDAGCGLRKGNPRDGLVTVLAMVEGEEGFVDQNGNGVYDVGEPFVDIGEPFLDSDDDGVRDPGEWYEDVNQDGQYNGPNGKWDAATVLWADTRVLYTGFPWLGRDTSGRELFSRLYAAGDPPAPTLPVAPFTVYAGPPATTQQYYVFFTDENLNPLTSGTSFSATPVIGNVTARLSRPDATVDSIATTFRTLYCDRADAGTCRDGPVEQGCVTSPCYVRTEIGKSFLYGNDATLAVTCVQVGPDQVEISATVEGATRSLVITGECL